MSQRYRVLAVLCLGEVLGMSIWFGFSAVKPLTAAEWGISNSEVGLVIAAFQFGYIAAVVAIGYLADRLGERVVLATGALVAALLNALFGLFADGLGAALVLRFLTGAAMGGVYTPGIRLLSTWFPTRERGRVVGIFVGAVVVGSASPYLVAPLAASVGWRALVLTTSAAGLAAAFLFGFGLPRAAQREGEAVRLDLSLLRDRPLALVNGAYTAHMWELYAMWGWIGPFVAAALVARGHGVAEATGLGGAVAFWSVAAGGAACVVGGELSDRFGRTRTASGFLLASAACSLAYGFLAEAPIALLVAVGLVYGFAIVGDSPVFSAAVTELAPPERRGTALGIQSLVGFGITIVSTALFGVIVDAAGWAPAFVMLAAGASFGPVLLWLLARDPRAVARLAGGRG